jgi:pyruvate/2-oxoglutarate dehydrogenase complex dihydrolipoamide dehydrogenase (E3) component
MVASARVAYLARRAAAFGVRTGPVTVDLMHVRQRKRNIVENWRSSSERRILSTERLDLIYGEARFVGRHMLEVHAADGTRRRLSGDRVFLNVGTRPAWPAIPGLEDVPALDSTSIMELDAVPEHLLIIGGGYVGLEFGQMFRRFGAAVTIVQRSAQLLPAEDDDVAEEITRILRDDGIDILLDADTQRIAQDREGRIRLTVATPAGGRALTGSHLLMAAGRRPNTDLLRPDAAGIATDSRGYIRVNERLETSVPGIYALGDVKGGPAFTHISYDDFRIIRANLRGGDKTTTGRLIPYTVFLDPQLGRVGLTERDARARGHRIRVAKLPMSHVARAVEVEETRGLMKAIVDAETGRILGCAILSIEGGEIMGILQLAIAGSVPYQVLRDSIFSHPTLSEALNSLFLAWEQEPMEVMLSQASYSASIMAPRPATP